MKLTDEKIRAVTGPISKKDVDTIRQTIYTLAKLIIKGYVKK